MRVSPLHTDGYYFYVPAQSPKGPGYLVVEDDSGETLLPPCEGTFTILEKCETEAEAEQCARYWEAQR